MSDERVAAALVAYLDHCVFVRASRALCKAHPHDPQYVAAHDQLLDANCALWDAYLTAGGSAAAGNAAYVARFGGTMPDRSQS